MLNKSPKAVFVYGEDAELRRLHLMLRFIIMVLKQKAMTLSLVIFSVLQLVQPSLFTSWTRVGTIPIPTFGRHNIMNATAVIGLLYTAGFDFERCVNT